MNLSLEKLKNINIKIILLLLGHISSALLLKEQITISVSNNLVVKQIQIRTKDQTSCSNFPANSPDLKRQHL